MKKNKHYFLRLAIVRTMASGALYLMMPIAAKFYDQFVDDKYIGYTVFGAGILILGNFILLVRSWALAFDNDIRKQYLKDD